MTTQLVTEPAMEPVSLDEAKAHLRVDTEDDDAYITGLILAARQVVEDDTRRALLTQSWLLTLDYHWPSDAHTGGRRMGGSGGLDPLGFGGGLSYHSRYRHHITLPRPPLQSVESIQYVDLSGVTQVLDPTQYVVNKSPTGEWRVTPGYNMVWPSVQPVPACISVAFTSGYGDQAGSIPEPLRIAILFLIGQWYDQRSPLHLFSRTAAAVQELPNTVESMVRRYRVFY